MQLALFHNSAPQRHQPRRSDCVHFSSAAEEWYTPAAIVERVVATLEGIDVDPCSNSATDPVIPAGMHFTRHDDGLSRDWNGTVYMNPPYGRAVADWVGKLVAEHTAGRTTEAVALLPARTDTKWFRRLRHFPKCFIHGRLRFSGCDQAAPFPSMTVYLGNRPQRFAEAFQDIGDVYVLRD